MKEFSIRIYLLVIPLLASAQQQENYIQGLAGTELEIDMVAVPSGTFTMGSPDTEQGRHTDEAPLRGMKIDGFWMSSHEITWELYNLFLQRSIDHFENDDVKEVNLDVDAVTGATIPYVDMSLGMGTGPGLPVVNITHKAALQFCKWLSAKTGHFYRLPTEAEWEYAARAGSNDAYFFGDDAALLETYAWYATNSDGTYHKVGEKKPNPFGLYDMYGNVAEWTMDQYNEEGFAKDSEPFEPITKEYPIAVRGGSFKDEAESLRSASRQGSKPVWKQRDPQFPRSKWWFTDAGFVGFRIVRPKKTPSPEEYSQYWGTE